jgi:EamA domain-containing membrane protein RarD
VLRRIALPVVKLFTLCIFMDVFVFSWSSGWDKVRSAKLGLNINRLLEIFDCRLPSLSFHDPR